MNYPSFYVGKVMAVGDSGVRLMVCSHVFRDVTGVLVNSQWFTEELWEGLHPASAPPGVEDYRSLLAFVTRRPCEP